MPTIADVEAARERLRGVARETPLYPTETFSRLTGRQVYLKAENLQRTGSFKIRGAYQHDRDARRERSGARASSPRAPGTTGRRSPGRRARRGSRRRSSCRRTRRWRRSRRRARMAGRPMLIGESFEEAVAAAPAHVERDGRDARACVRGRTRHRRAGHDRPRARQQAPDAETVLDSDRRRRARRGDRPGAEASDAPT